jgi:hypothetical protein
MTKIFIYNAAIDRSLLEAKLQLLFGLYNFNFALLKVNVRIEIVLKVSLIIFAFDFNNLVR